MVTIYVDADACPVKDEVERVATRHQIRVVMVADGGVRPRQNPLVEIIIVPSGTDAADDRIADLIYPGDICVTADIPLAARCIAAGGMALRPNGEKFTEAGIGMELARRNLMQDLREAGAVTGGPAPFQKKDRSNFLNSLEVMVQAAKRAV